MIWTVNVHRRRPEGGAASSDPLSPASVDDTLNGPDRVKEGFNRPLYEQELAIKSFNETVEEFRVTVDAFIFRHR